MNTDINISTFDDYKYRYIFSETETNLTDDQFDILIHHTGYIYHQLLTGKTEYVIDGDIIGSKYGAFSWNDGFDVLYLPEDDILILGSDEYYLWMDELIDSIGVNWETVEVIAPDTSESQ